MRREWEYSFQVHESRARERERERDPDEPEPPWYHAADEQADWYYPELEPERFQELEPEAPGLLRIVPMEKREDGVREYSREREVRRETGRYEMAIDEGRFEPAPYDLGITDQPQNELGQPLEREVRGEPDPYDPLYFQGYRYWAPGREAG